MKETRSRKDIEVAQQELGKEYAKAEASYEKDERTKRVVAEVASRLRGHGTSEGRASVEREVTKAGASTDAKFAADAATHEKVVERTAKPLANELGQMAKDSRLDASAMEAAAAKAEVAEAKAAVENATRAAREDADFAEGREKAVDAERSASEQAKEKVRAKMASLRVTFKR